ncbi:DUF6928 family protein [Streptomyces tamarix]|uniref:DUF6928 family protein n=1 Tax=Streptomyces tamarix TaxID=3078565 RepID=UPI0037044AF1
MPWASAVVGRLRVASDGPGTARLGSRAWSDLGEDALRALCGFIQEGRPQPDDVDAEAIALYGFHVRDPHGPDPAEQEVVLRRAAEAMPPPRVYTLGPDSSSIERDGL